MQQDLIKFPLDASKTAICPIPESEKTETSKVLLSGERNIFCPFPISPSSTADGIIVSIYSPVVALNLE